MNILVTGAAGFIGNAVCARLVRQGHTVVGVDNINSYYDPALKYARLRELGIDSDKVVWNDYITSHRHGNFTFIRINLEDTNAIRTLFADINFDCVINLAAQAGVRYSIENPHAYVESNILGFLNILEGCRENRVGHLVYASSSSVYGLNGKVPFSEHDNVAHPVSLYAATKKSNELMAHAYSALYGLPTTGLRFFTVYDPWGRPDMASLLFIDAILHNRPIKVFNNGDMFRDFTYIDDTVESIVRVINHIPQPDTDWNPQKPDPASSHVPYRIYNIGNQHPVQLLDYIECIEKATGMRAKKENLPMQAGDMYHTFSDSSELSKAVGFYPNTPLQEGINKTVAWFKEYNNII